MFLNRKIPAFIIIFNLFWFASYAQIASKKVDSIKVLLKKATNDSLFVRHSIELGILIDTSSPFNAEQHFNNALEILNGSYNFNDKFKMMALAIDCLGIIERRRNNYDKALTYYLRSLKIKEENNDSLKIGRSYHNISMLFAAQKDYTKAISYMKLALPLRKHDSIDYGISLCNYGNFFYKKKQYIIALKILDSATSFLHKDPIRLADVYTINARIYRAKKEYKKALTILEKNLEIYSNFNKLERKANTFKSIAICYRKMKKYESAFISLDSSENIAKIYGNKKLIYQIYLDRYKIFKSKKDYKNALTNYRTYKKYYDSVFKNKQSIKVATLELQYKNEKQLALQKLKHETEKQHLLALTNSQRFQKRFYASLLIIAILCLIGIFYYSKYRSKVDKDNLKKQELDTNLMQEKVNFLQFKINQLLANGKMRSDFKDELISKLKLLKQEQNSKNLISEYQSILIQLENQHQTEKRLNTTNTKMFINQDTGFELKLAQQFPELTKSEREICHLIYLNLSLKEIMNIRNITMASVKSARYRIRKKLNVPKGTELELFINNLFN